MSGTMEVNGAKVDMGKLEAASKKMEAAAASDGSGQGSSFWSPPTP
jgi:hypothetical protein